MNFIENILKKRQEKKVAKKAKQLQNLRLFFETENNKGLLYHRIAHHSSTYRTHISEGWSTTVNIDMHDGFSIYGYDTLSAADALKDAGRQLVDRLEELNKITKRG